MNCPFSFFILILFTALLSLFSIHSQASPSLTTHPTEFKTIVLLTGFNPYNGADLNNSEEILKEFYEGSFNLNQLKNSNVELHTCFLPSSYEKAFLTFKACFEKIKKETGKNLNIILSIGETSDHCKTLDLETQAQNFTSDANPDNDGIKIINQKVLQNGNPFEAFSFTKLFNTPPHSNAGHSPLLPEKITISPTMGNFICNHFAYQTQAFLNNESKDSLFAFMHTPSHNQSSCVFGKLKPIKAAGAIVQLLLNVKEKTENDPRN